MKLTHKIIWLNWLVLIALFHQDLILQIGIKRVIGKLAVKSYRIIESAIQKIPVWWSPLYGCGCILPSCKSWWSPCKVGCILPSLITAALLARNRSCIGTDFPPLPTRGAKDFPPSSNQGGNSFHPFWPGGNSSCYSKTGAGNMGELTGW